MLALSIRQPFAEMILRGVKTVEYRSRPTRRLGERFYIYASKGAGEKLRNDWPADAAEGNGDGRRVWSGDLSLPEPPPPPWMIELAEALRLWSPQALAALPRGLIVGSAVIRHCSPLPAHAANGSPMYGWHLADVERIADPRPPRGRPQPVWFRPF